MPDPPAVGGPVKAPFNALDAERALLGKEDENVRALVGPLARLQRQNRLRVSVSQCLIRALEELKGPAEPQQEPLWLGLVGGTACLLLANALSSTVRSSSLGLACM